MALIMLLFIIGAMVFIVNNTKKPSNKRPIRTYHPQNRKIHAEKNTFEDDFQKTLRIIRENRKKRKAKEYVPTYESPIARIYRQDLEKMFKSDFQNDPEWQKKAKNIREIVQQNTKISRQEIDDVE